MARKTRTAAAFDDRTAEEKLQDAIWAAKAAFEARAAELGNTDWELSAIENCFSVECYAEYRDDLHRWEIALATLNMLADQAG